jgi:PAS domain S-box-containing protein
MIITEQIPQNLRILVADDEPGILKLFRKVLLPATSSSSLSFDLVTCQQGENAVDAVKKSLEESRPFSAAFIDVRMPPGRGGIWAAEQIRRLDKNVEILIMTGYDGEHPRDISHRAPPVHKLLYVQKPIHPQEIYQFASSLSMKWHAECELQKLNKNLEQCVEERIQEFKIINKELQVKIAELQKSQSALTESEGKLNAMMLSVPDHVIMMDKDLNIIWANNTAKNIFGEKILGKKCYNVYHQRQEPCEFPSCLTLKAFEDGQTHSRETKVVDKDGSIRFFYCTANVALRDENNNPLTIIEIARDITEQKQSQQFLRESEERYRALAENSRVGFWQATLDGHTLYINPAMCRMLEIERPEEVHERSYFFFFDAKNQKIIKIEHAKREQGISSTYEVELTGKKGTKRNMMISGAPIFFSEDKLHSTIATFTDITELKKIEKALMKSKNELEHRVEARTFELSNALETIKQSEKQLLQRKLSLEKVNKELMETNQAVSVLAKNMDKKKEELERRLFKMCNGKILPILKKLQKDVHCQKRQADLELVVKYLHDATHDLSFDQQIDTQLTDQEMRVAIMIKNGLTSQQIADLLCISPHTVKTHRKNIRKKLKISDTKINLVSYLKSKLRSDPMK